MATGRYDMKVDFDWLEEHVFHRSLTDSEKSCISQLITVHHYPAGEKFIIEKGIGGTLYIIRSGTIELILAVNGEMLHVANLREGSQVGDMAFLDEGEATSVIKVTKDCVAYKISRSALASLLVFRRGLHAGAGPIQATDTRKQGEHSAETTETIRHN